MFANTIACDKMYNFDQNHITCSIIKSCIIEILKQNEVVLIFFFNYCKPTFIREREIFAMLARTSSSRIFPATNQPLSYSCQSNSDLYKAYSRILIIANQFISSKSRKYDVGNKSWFTVLTDTNGHMQVYLSFETLCSSQV